MFNLKKQVFTALACAFVIAACESSPVPVVQEDKPQLPYRIINAQAAEVRPDIISRDELTVVFSMQDMELDFRKSYFASEAQIFTGIYEGLFSYHPLSLEPVPALASRWELSDDKMQWTFNIRQNARYWNGDPVRAEDFRAAWLSLIEPGRESPYSSLFDVIEGAHNYRNGIEKDPAKVGIIAPDARTLIVKLSSPASFFPAMLCHHSFSPIHPSMIDVDDWSLNVPVSNGPFRITAMDEDSIVLSKNEMYWDHQGIALNKIIIKFIEDPIEAASMWNSGESRWIAGNVDLEALTDRSGIQLNVMFATHYYFVRSEVKPWDDKRIRRAMALVLPWEEIRNNYFMPAETLIFPVSGYPEVKGISEADYEEAQRLMSEAGYAGGEGMPELVIRLTPSQDAARIGSLMAVAWKEILGINVRVEVISYDRYFQSMKESGYVIGSSTWIGDFADPYTFLQMWRRDSNLNDAHFNDNDYEALIERSMLEEGNVRMATLAEAEKLLLDRGVVLPIFYHPALNIIDTGEVDGWYPNALDIHPFRYFSFRAYRPLPGVVMAK
ncbi:MAG: peptide ABC transporter substrate-binding protein [Treponema sp.]|jgi:peptide/nickel transport system substrate-binding protein/oligopeptide transport system substrate-binding protein|nr:peptide ABC transporter substrate-binding protein [Treponema sp.]